jgi:hypothetical protein
MIAMKDNAEANRQYTQTPRVGGVGRHTKMGGLDVKLERHVNPSLQF